MHQRDEEGYEQEDYDDYEEEASEQEEDDEREAPISSKEEQEFLKLREELKEKFRQKLKQQNAGAFGHQSLSQNEKRPTSDNFGSFFGPSRPVISSRVIDESRLIREMQHIASRAPSSASRNVKGAASMSSGQKMHVRHQQQKVVNEVKKKAQTLKDMRDYSFLLSDDADFPAPTMEECQQPASRKASAPKSDVRSVQASSKHRPAMVGKVTPNAHELKISAAKNMQSQTRIAQLDGHKSKISASKNMQSQTRAVQAKGASVSKPRPVAAEARKISGGNATNGSGQPVGHKYLHSNLTVQATSANRHPALGTNDPSLKKRPSAVPHSSTQKNLNSEQRNPSGGMDKVKAPAKQSLLSSKPSAAKPQKRIPHLDIREEQLKKQAVKKRFDEDDDDDAFSMLRKLTGYNPNKYAGMDEDDSDMEADFSTIQKEERRSAKIARKEDEEQLRLIEEEERRERLRKKQKLSRW